MGPNIWLRGRNWPSFGPLAFRPFGTKSMHWHCRVPHAVVIKHTFTLSHFHIFKLSHFSHWKNPVLRNRERSTMRGKWEDFLWRFCTIHNTHCTAYYNKPCPQCQDCHYQQQYYDHHKVMNYRLFWARIPFMERLPQLLTPKQSVPSLLTLQYFKYFKHF